MGWPAIILCAHRPGGVDQTDPRQSPARRCASTGRKTLVSAAAAILIAALATGAFYGAMALGAPTTGVVLFFVVFLVGVIALAVVVNRRWPGAKAP